MKRRFLPGLMILTAVPGAGWAADQSINIGANVAKFCQFNAAPTIPASLNITSGSLGTATSTVSITTPTSALGVMQPWSFTFTINATCNHISELKLTTLNGGLKDLTHGSLAPGFINRFDYTASASFDGAGPALLITSGTPGAASMPPPQLTTAPWSNLVTLHVNGLPNTTAPLMAGNYADTLILSLLPQP